jgi:hypothetical protein
MQVYPNVLVKPDFVISKGVVKRAQLFWNISYKNFQKLKEHLQKIDSFMIDDHYLHEKIS